MADALARLNELPRAEAIALLLQCCGARRWAEHMADARPYAHRTELLDTADAVWTALGPADWLEAFRAHPRIGERASPSEEGRHVRWSEQEQAGAHAADVMTRTAIAELNRAYEQRFGHIFLICATGRSGDEMLDELRRRIQNEPDEEMRAAAEEQRRITRIRLEKLL